MSSLLCKTVFSMPETLGIVASGYIESRLVPRVRFDGLIVVVTYGPEGDVTDLRAPRRRPRLELVARVTASHILSEGWSRAAAYIRTNVVGTFSAATFRSGVTVLRRCKVYGIEHSESFLNSLIFRQASARDAVARADE
jgi:hypothetical protein